MLELIPAHLCNRYVSAYPVDPWLTWKLCARAQRFERRWCFLFFQEIYLPAVVWTTTLKSTRIVCAIKQCIFMSVFKLNDLLGWFFVFSLHFIASAAVHTTIHSNIYTILFSLLFSLDSFFLWLTIRFAHWCEFFYKVHLYYLKNPKLLQAKSVCLFSYWNC